MAKNFHLSEKENMDETDLMVIKARKALHHLKLEKELENQIILRPGWNNALFN